ncbi:MAG: phosphopantetheine-binding protein [Acutalibacteraceae bacterium]|nr:phosphopantetheine-binding protein [Acutalibacteraceae bacterium]
MNIKDKVRNFVMQYVGEHSLKDDENMFELGLVNSLFGMQLIRFVEDEFDIAVSNDELDISNFQSIDAITSLVERLKKA